AGLIAALVCAAPASARLEPVIRSQGLLKDPRVRVGTIRPPAAGADARVIVTLKLPPLAAATLPSRAFASIGSRHKVNFASPAAKAYLARVDSAQRRAVAALRRAIPDAQVSRRFRIVLDGLTVSVRSSELQKLFRLGFVDKVYPSLTYTRSLNRSTSLIGAPELASLTGARGDGVKIGIVDDGVDQNNPFFDATGYSYPAGFPKGQTNLTTPKVIVAKAFPGPGSGPEGRLAVDRQFSFHGTAVAGVSAGNAGTTPPATTAICSGSAPSARPERPPTRSASQRSRTRTSSATRSPSFPPRPARSRSRSYRQARSRRNGRRKDSAWLTSARSRATSTSARRPVTRTTRASRRFLRARCRTRSPSSGVGTARSTRRLRGCGRPARSGW